MINNQLAFSVKLKETYFKYLVTYEIKRISNQIYMYLFGMRDKFINYTLNNIY